MPADLWLQIDVKLPSSKLVMYLRDDCGVTTNEAIGLLVRLWSAVMQVGCGGDLRERSDSWIEEESGWRGSPGTFARFVRERHLDDGVIRDWPETYGKLEAIRFEAARIKRNQRSRQSTGPSGVRPPDTGVDSSLISVLDLSSAVALQKRNEVDDVTEFVGQFDFGPFAPAVEGFLRSTTKLAAVLATIRMHAIGELGHEIATHRQLGLAIQNYAANESARGFNAKYFAGHVRDAKTAVEVISNRQRNTAERQFIDEEAENAARYTREEEEADRVLTDFSTTNTARFGELERIAEEQVPKKLKIGREIMVRAKLLTLVRAEVACAR